MWTRTTRWAIAALFGAAMTNVGCGNAPQPHEMPRRIPVVAADSDALDSRADVTNKLAFRTGW